MLSFAQVVTAENKRMENSCIFYYTANDKLNDHEMELKHLLNTPVCILKHI